MDDDVDRRFKLGRTGIVENVARKLKHFLSNRRDSWRATSPFAGCGSFAGYSRRVAMDLQGCQD
jgi:hypothetical protein